MTVTNSIKYIGVNDKTTDLFEGQYAIPNGMAYNSYVILDEKIAVMDTVDIGFADEWLSNLKGALNGKTPSYLIIHHMEPDHSACILRFALEYPEAKFVATAKAFSMLEGYFKTSFPERQIVVKDRDTLSLGKHELTFYTAPMVHWPEVMVTYDALEGVLFSADAFGKFGANDIDEPWADEARRYYIGIVGKYGNQVKTLFGKIEGLDIKIICSLHGPVLKDNLAYYLELYDAWASYRPEEDGVAIAYTSVYGNTKRAVEILKEKLAKDGIKVTLHDLSRCDMATAVSDAFKYSTLVLASTTYNGSVFPHMREFISHLTERGFKNRRIALIENGTWAPLAAKVMRAMLEEASGLEFTDTTVSITSALNEKSLASIDALAKELKPETA